MKISEQAARGRLRVQVPPFAQYENSLDFSRLFSYVGDKEQTKLLWFASGLVHRKYVRRTTEVVPRVLVKGTRGQVPPFTQHNLVYYLL